MNIRRTHIVMKKFAHLLLGCTVWLCSCQSLEQISIDYMRPAKISFPDELKRIGIVNNVPNDLPNRLSNRWQDQPDIETGNNFRQTRYYNGLPEVTAEAMAHAMADEQYFEQVVICDSALRAHDTRLRAGGLTGEEVNQLASDLDVDLLVSLESVQMRSVREVTYMPEFGFYVGDLETHVRPVLKLYLPGKNEPMALINAADSIYWDEVGNTADYVRTHLIDEDEMLRQASDYAGTLAVKDLLPYWETDSRYYFTGGNVKMRDAGVYAREGHWAEATALWEEAYAEARKAKTQFYAAYNLALGHEMQDDIATACQWIQTAAEKAAQTDYAQLAQHYLQILQERRDYVTALNAQLRRFKEN